MLLDSPRSRHSRVGEERLAAERTARAARVRSPGIAPRCDGGVHRRGGGAGHPGAVRWPERRRGQQLAHALRDLASECRRAGPRAAVCLRPRVASPAAPRPPAQRAGCCAVVGARRPRARTGRQRSGCEQSSAPASGAGQASPPRLPCLHPPDPGPNPDPTSSLRPRPASARAPTPIVRCAGRLGDFGHHDQQVCFADL